MAEAAAGALAVMNATRTDSVNHPVHRTAQGKTAVATGVEASADSALEDKRAARPEYARHLVSHSVMARFAETTDAADNAASAARARPATTACVKADLDLKAAGT